MMCKSCDVINITTFCMAVSRTVRSTDLLDACVNLQVSDELMTVVDALAALIQKVESNNHATRLTH